MQSPRFDFLVLGIFGIIAFYHGLLYLFQPRRRAPLYLALFCVLMSIRLFTVNGYLRESFPEYISPVFIVKLERLAATLAVPVFAFYLRYLFSGRPWDLLARAAVFVVIPFLAFAFLPDALYREWVKFHEVFEYIMIGFLFVGVFGLARGALARRDVSAALVLAGFLILSISAVSQMLAGRGWITFGNYLQLGTAGFILMQVLVVARANSRAQARAEKLTEELAGVNADLESRVRERTADLNAALDELSGKLALLDQNKKLPPAASNGRLLAFKERGGHHTVLPVHEISYLSSHKDNTMIHGPRHEYETVALLRNMEKRLPPTRFVRVHKQYIVNLDRIDRIEYMAGGNYILTLKDEDETQLPVGRTYAAGLKERLGLEKNKGPVRDHNANIRESK